MAVMHASWHNAGLCCSDGEIGRHCRLKICRREACRFDSGSEHHPVILPPTRSLAPLVNSGASILSIFKLRAKIYSASIVTAFEKHSAHGRTLVEILSLKCALPVSRTNRIRLPQAQLSYASIRISNNSILFNAVFIAPPYPNNRLTGIRNSPLRLPARLR